jgi:hypothetical protein
MTDSFETLDLRNLAAPREGPCVTFYLPTHAVGENGQQDAIRLKNLINTAERELVDGWLRAPAARDLLAPVAQLPADQQFWENRSHGLALFVEPGSLHKFRVSVPLNELALVSRRFHLKPLLPVVNSSQRFLVLTLSQRQVRLLEATLDDIEPLDVPGLPERMDQALNIDTVDRGSQVHSAMRGDAGKQAGVFHGQGGARETRKEDLALFFQMVDRAIGPVLRDEQAPLVLAGVDYLLPIFRDVCRYPHVAEPELTGNFDYSNLREVHEKVCPLVRPLFDRNRQEAISKYQRLAGTGHTGDDLSEIVGAAWTGRVETLFVAADDTKWGTFDDTSNTVVLHNSWQRGDDDLLDIASANTFLNRGEVHLLNLSQMPAPNKPIAAIYRY